MALPRDQRFQNLTVDFKKMNKLSMRDRMDMLGTRQGADLLSSLDPSQLKSLFPDYYKKDEGLSQTLSAITGRNIKPSETVKDQTAGRSVPPTERDLRRRNTASRAREEERLPEWARKLGVTARKDDAPQLTGDQKTVLEQLRQGIIASDDPRVSFLNDMTPEQRQKAGIVESEQDGKKSFAFKPITDEEAKGRLNTGIVRPGSEGLQGRGQMAKATYDAFVQAGLSDKQARAAVAQVNRENSLNPKYMFGTHGEHAAHVRGRTNYGIFSWGDPTRAKNFLDFMKQNGVMDSSGKVVVDNETYLKQQARFAVQEMRGTTAGQKFLENPNISTVDADNLLGRHIGWDMAGRRHDLSKSLERMAEGRKIIDAVNDKFPGTLPENATPEQIENARNLIENERRAIIASSQPRPQLPAGLDPKFVETYNRLPIAQAQQVAAGLGKVSQELGEAGIRKFNTEFLGNPNNTLSQLSSTGEVGSHRFADEGVYRRMGNLSDDARDSATRFLKYSSTGTITSTYRDPERNRRAGGVSGSAHTGGNAIDVRTNGRSREQMLEDIRALKQAGFNKVLIEKNHLHAERVSGSGDFSISVRKGHKPPEGLTLEEAQTVASQTAFNLPLDRPDEQPQSQQQQPQQAQQTPPPISQTGRPQQQAQSETPEVAALSYGGEVQTDAKELTAVPMGQARTDVSAPLDRRDNMAVIDEKGQTQFTINDNETVSLKNGKAEVQTEEMIKSDEIKPIEDSLKREERENEKEQANRLEMVRSQAQTDNQINDTNMQNINDSAVSATEELFRTPSFTRAMKERHFMKDESPMGGNHFSPV